MANNKEKLGLTSEEKISDFPKKYNNLVGIVKRLTASVILLGLAVIILELGLIFEEEIDRFFNFLGVNWGQLTEGYKLLILGILGSIIAGIIIHIINKKYIDPLLERNSE